MPKLSEMAKNARYFLDDILPQSFCVGATPDVIQKQFSWALYCEKLIESLDSSEKLDNFKAIAKISDGLEFEFLCNAIARLLENYMHNSQRTDAEVLQVLAAVSRVVNKERLSKILSSLAERNILYQHASALAQTTEVNILMSQLLKECFTSPGNRSLFHNKLQSAVGNIGGMEVFLKMYLNTKNDENFSQEMRDFLLEQLRNWLDNSKPCAAMINSLLAAPVDLTRAVCLRDSLFFGVWLRVLSSLASNLQPKYYQHEHSWVWPSEEETNAKFHGIWFAFEQLSRHFSSLLGPSDDVSDKTWGFIEDKQNEVNCSLWLDLCRNVTACRKVTNKLHL